jgi:hypothetical protein
MLVRHRTDSPWRTWGIAPGMRLPRQATPKAFGGFSSSTILNPRHIARRNQRRACVATHGIPSYDDLERDYDRRVIAHAESYAQGHVHTNCLENFWSLLKRSLHGTYVNVEPFHLFRYLDEQAFRFNQRKAADSERFMTAVPSISGRRLTYRGLTGNVGCN